MMAAEFRPIVLSRSKAMATSVVAVSLHGLFLAECRIAGCIKCTDRADVRFERLLDGITQRPTTTTYILPIPALCPICQNLVVESTLVQPKVQYLNRVMGSPQRTKPPRFKIRDQVAVLNTVKSRFAGKTGGIVAVEESRHATNLDKYTVRFEDAAENVFWEFQLKSMQ